jgi:hypothetical protein
MDRMSTNSYNTSAPQLIGTQYGMGMQEAMFQTISNNVNVGRVSPVQSESFFSITLLTKNVRRGGFATVSTQLAMSTCAYDSTMWYDGVDGIFSIHRACCIPGRTQRDFSNASICRFRSAYSVQSLCQINRITPFACIRFPPQTIILAITLFLSLASS